MGRGDTPLQVCVHGDVGGSCDTSHAEGVLGDTAVCGRTAVSAGGTRRRPRAVSEGTATLPAALCCLRPLGRNQRGNAYGGRELTVTAPSPPRRSGRDLNAAGATALAPPFPTRGPRQGQQLRGPPASLWHLGTWRRVPGCPIAATSGVRAWGQTPWRSATLDKLLDHCRVPQRPRL